MEIAEKVREAKGGPMMTVVEVNGDKVICQWNNGKHNVQQEFEISQLTKWVIVQKHWQVA